MDNLVSDAFKIFNSEASEHAGCWKELIQGLSKVSTLDKRTYNLAYLSVLAVLGRKNGIPFHVKIAKSAGATREEIISALLVGLPAAGHIVTEVLPKAVETFDEEI